MAHPSGAAGDAPELARLGGKLGYPSTDAQIQGRFDRIGSDCDHALLVAEDNGGRIGGWVHVFINKLREADPRAEIGGLVADPAMRRQGSDGRSCSMSRTGPGDGVSRWFPCDRTSSERTPINSTNGSATRSRKPS